MKKRALVLAGGGSKGAYEVGFVKALNELGIDYQIVTGTSIGALNGCLIAQNDFDAMEELWNEMDVTTVFAEGFHPDMSTDLDSMLSQSNLAVNFFKKYLKEKGADITPLLNVVRGLLKEDQFLNSDIDYGLCTVHYPNLKPLFITKHEMEKEHIFDYLISSASCFPVFPIHTFKEQSFIDGGYYDNVPIDLAFDMGADEVIVVDMKMEPTHPHYLHRPNIIYTTPYVDLGGFLDFTRESIERNKRIGYQTAMKYFNHYSGVKYTFEKFETPLFYEFYKDVLYIERSIRTRLRKDSSGNLVYKYMESNKDQPLSFEDYFYVTLDWLAELSDKDESQVYKFDEFVEDLFKEYDKYMHEDFKMISLASSEHIFKSFENVSKKGIVGRILHGFLYPEEGDIDIETFVTLFAKEVMMARLLFMLYQNKDNLH